MAIIKAAARLILRERSRYMFAGPALSLGVPDIYLTAEELRAATGPGDVDPKVGRENGHTADNITAERFFDALGVSPVTSIDIEGAALDPDLRHDLNLPLPASMVDRFDLVLDPGTTEHVFDVRTGLTNVVRALRVGGVVIHFVPVYSYNGGYFSINPNVLHDFYAANAFTDIRAYLIMWDRFRPFRGRSRCYEYTQELAGRHALADRDQCRYVPHLLFFARKDAAHDDVVVPIQHEDHHVHPPRTLGRLARRVLPEDTVIFLASWLRREAQLRRTHRRSFWI